MTNLAFNWRSSQGGQGGEAKTGRQCAFWHSDGALPSSRCIWSPPHVINHVALELNSLKNGACVFVVKTPPCPSPECLARHSEIMLILAISVISRWLVPAAQLHLLNYSHKRRSNLDTLVFLSVIHFAVRSLSVSQDHHPPPLSIIIRLWEENNELMFIC